MEAPSGGFSFVAIRGGIKAEGREFCIQTRGLGELIIFRHMMNVVGVESNSGQQRQTGGRSRRRNVADLNNARSREAEFINKPATTSAAAMSVTIVVDDEDDDVLVSSPRSFAQVLSGNDNDYKPITWDACMHDHDDCDGVGGCQLRSNISASYASMAVVA